MRRWLGVAVGVALEGCFLSPLPDMKTPEDRAHALDAKCRRTDDSVAATAPEAVEPEIAHVAGGPNGREARFRGARLRLAPSAGTSPEAIERGLLCHQAAVTLGRAAARDDDPYVLPGRWLTIDVASSGDGFLVRVEADDLDDAQLVLERARRRQSLAASAVPASPVPASPPLGQPLPLQ